MGEEDALAPRRSMRDGYGAAPLLRRRTTASFARDEGPLAIRGTPLGRVRNAMAGGIAAYASHLNWLLLFVPLGFLAAVLRASPTLVFMSNFIGMVPLALLLSRATEDIADQTNQTFGALLNVTLGNAVELIISVSALRTGKVALIKDTLIGSILSNLLLVLGSAFFVRWGGGGGGKVLMHK